MPIPVTLVLCCFCVVGCDENSPKSSIASDAINAQAPQTSAPHGSSVGAEPGRALETDKHESVSPYVFRLPQKFKPEDIAGLDVDVTVTESEGKGGYYIDIWAVNPAGSVQKELKIGDYAVFKPLSTQDHVIISIEAPPHSAWKQNDGGHELALELKVAPAKPNGVVPKVRLHIAHVSVARK